MVGWFEILVDHSLFENIENILTHWICYLDIVQKKNGRESNGQDLWSCRFENSLFLRQDTHIHGRFICFLLRLSRLFLMNILNPFHYVTQ